MAFTRLIATLAVLVSPLITTDTVGAQCCQEKAKEKANAECCSDSVAKSQPGASAKVVARPAVDAKVAMVKLFNDTCPITGLPTSAQTPVVAVGNTLVSLCCNGCISTFRALAAEKKTAFIAKFSGKNRRTSFPKVTAKAAKAPAAEKSCCSEKDTKAAKAPVAEKDCCSEKASKPAKAPAAAEKSCCSEKDSKATKAPVAKKAAKKLLK